MTVATCLRRFGGFHHVVDVAFHVPVNLLGYGRRAMAKPERDGLKVRVVPQGRATPLMPYTVGCGLGLDVVSLLQPAEMLPDRSSVPGRPSIVQENCALIIVALFATNQEQEFDGLGNQRNDLLFSSLLPSLVFLQDDAAPGDVYVRPSSAGHVRNAATCHAQEAHSTLVALVRSQDDLSQGRVLHGLAGVRLLIAHASEGIHADSPLADGPVERRVDLIGLGFARRTGFPARVLFYPVGEVEGPALRDREIAARLGEQTKRALAFVERFVGPKVDCGSVSQIAVDEFTDGKLSAREQFGLHGWGIQHSGCMDALNSRGHRRPRDYHLRAAIAQSPGAHHDRNRPWSPPARNSFSVENKPGGRNCQARGEHSPDAFQGGRGDARRCASVGGSEVGRQLQSSCESFANVN